MYKLNEISTIQTKPWWAAFLRRNSIQCHTLNTSTKFEIRKYSAVASIACAPALLPCTFFVPLWNLPANCIRASLVVQCIVLLFDSNGSNKNRKGITSTRVWGCPINCLSEKTIQATNTFKTIFCVANVKKFNLEDRHFYETLNHNGQLIWLISK